MREKEKAKQILCSSFQSSEFGSFLQNSMVPVLKKPNNKHLLYFEHVQAAAGPLCIGFCDAKPDQVFPETDEKNHQSWSVNWMMNFVAKVKQEMSERNTD